jgi:type IV pilus assembly protein PilM
VARAAIGVDIGSTAVRGAEVRVRKGRPHIVRAAEIPLPPGAVIAGELREPAVVQNAMRLLWKQGRFSKRDVSLGVANQQTLVRQIDLPFEPGEDFKASLPIKVGQDLPVDSSELTMDYYRLEDYLDSKGRPHRKALLVGALTSVVENAAAAVSDARLKPTSIDFSGFALIRTATFTHGNPRLVPGPTGPEEEISCEVVVDMGAQLTIVAIHHAGRPLFIRLAGGGGDSVTRAISDHLGLRWEVADALKRSLGIGGIVPANQTAAKLIDEVPEAALGVAQQIVNMMASSLVQSVRESVEYFLAASPQVSGVDRIFLSGGASLLPGYAERVAAELRTGVSMLTPLQHYSSKRKAKRLARLDPKFAIAVGLGLGVR